jgi:hypothetical protein
MERGQHPQAYCGTVPYMFYILHASQGRHAALRIAFALMKARKIVQGCGSHG